jgi:uncharacterized membrane protein YphA (DoxX/SURF4 family)
MDRISQIVSNRWLVLAARLLLGGIFLVSAIGKLQHPALFVDTVVDYGMLPEGLSRFYGTVLPWAEVAIGFSLILGLLSLASAVVSMALTVSFAVAAIYSFSHPAPTMCGCFGDLVALSHSQSLAMDVAMLLMAAVIVVARRNADELGLARFIKGIVRGQIGWLTVVLKVAVVGLLTLALGLVITATGEEPAPEPPATEKPRLVYFWNGCDSCYLAEVNLVKSLQPEFGDRVDFVEVDWIVNPEALSIYGVTDDDFAVLLLAWQSETSRHGEYARFVGNLEAGTFNLAAIRDRLETLLNTGGQET